MSGYLIYSKFEAPRINDITCLNIFTKNRKEGTPISLRIALERCISADSERGKAFIYKKFYGYVMAVVFRYIRFEMEAEEVVNESFVKVFAKLKTFERNDDDTVLEKTFKAWMAKIAVNSSIDRLRSKRQMQFIDDEDDTEILNLSVEMNSSLEINDIMQLLNALSDIQKTIFNMFEIEGYSHEEIGQKLGIPESTSRTYLTRAKQKLRALYLKHFENENVKS